MANTVIRWDGRKAIVHPAGNVVAPLVPELRSALREALTKGANELIIDLEAVQVIDSSGLGLLVSAHNSIRKPGGRLAVVNASKDILNLLYSMRIHQHFSVSGTSDPA
jgi:anti-anti-sigma factor